MRCTAIVLFVVANLGLAACGEEPAEEPIDAWVDEEYDGGSPLTCNPVANTGCGENEKCTFIVDSAGPPVLGHTGCVPDGTVALGGACVRDGVGVDDCAGALYCADGTCEDLCSVAPDSCPTDYTCVHMENHFEDDNLGTCAASCDLLAQDCPNPKSCYILLGREGFPTVCRSPAPEPGPEAGGCGLPGATVPGRTDDCCTHINTCELGWGCIQRQDPIVTWELECAYFCDPTGTVPGAPQNCNLPGPGPGFECIQINHFYRDVPELPDTHGFCIRRVEWGPATCWNWVSDMDEDGSDCCAVDDPNPLCECIYPC